MTKITVKEALFGQKGPVQVQGWIRTKRESKEIVFLEINDGSCQKNLQAVIEKGQGDLDQLLPGFSTGAGVSLEGKLNQSPGNKQSWELLVQKAKIYGPASEDFPLQKKRHSFEFLREIAHLRPRSNTFGAINRVRNTLSMAVHGFFQTMGYYWVHTPIITSSDAEGAGSLFKVTTLDQPGSGDEDFFGQKTHLTVSGQLNAEALACSMGRVYTFGPTFRAENSHTSRHLSEFWMVEPETAFCEIKENMDLAEDFIRFLVQEVLEKNPEEMSFFDQWIEKGLIQSLEKLKESTFQRLTYTEALGLLKQAKTDFQYPLSWGLDLQSEHERYLCEEILQGPVILTDYPKDIKAFYMKGNEDGKTVKAMDVLVPRLGEIIGGSQREEDLGKLEKRMRELSMEPKDYSWYLDLRRFGSVPHSGFGLGFERMIQYITGMQNIRDVIPFPRTPGKIQF